MVWVYKSVDNTVWAKQNGMPDYFIDVKSHLPMTNKAIITLNEQELFEKFLKIDFEHEKQEKDSKGFQLPNRADSGSGHWVVEKDGRAVLVGINVKAGYGDSQMMRTTDGDIMRFIKKYLEL